MKCITEQILLKLNYKGKPNDDQRVVLLGGEKMFNLDDLAKYSPYYEVYWRKGFQEGSAEFGIEELQDAEKLYSLKMSENNWDYVELRMVLDSNVESAIENLNFKRSEKMSIRDKMVQLKVEFNEDEHRIKEYSNIDRNGLGKSDSITIIPEGMEIDFLNSFIEDYDKYGEVAGFDGKGYKVTITDFEIIKKEEAEAYEKNWWNNLK